MYVLCFVLTDKAHAQRCLPGIRGLRITAGMTDGFHTVDKRNELGYHFGLGMDRYVNGCHKWVFGGEYLQKYYPYKDIRVPISQFTAEGGYYYNFLSDANKVFLCYAGASALAGYETVKLGYKYAVRRLTLACRGCVYLWRCCITGDRNLSYQSGSIAVPCP